MNVRGEDGSSGLIALLIGLLATTFVTLFFLIPFMVTLAIKPPAQAFQSDFVRDIATNGGVSVKGDPRVLPTILGDEFEKNTLFDDATATCVLVRPGGAVVRLVDAATVVSKGDLVGCRVRATNYSWPLWWGPDLFLGGHYQFTAWAYSDSQDDRRFQ